MDTTHHPLHWSLFLDVDGTLVDFASTPDEAVIDEALKEILRRVRLALQGAVAIVSGRSLGQIDRMFAPTRWPAAGLHGLERRNAQGKVFRADCTDETLASARRSLVEIASCAPGVLVEDKGSALALHYRLAPAVEPALRRELHAIAQRLGPGYHVQEGSHVLELRPAAATKADAIRAFMAEPPFRDRRPMFVGDDLTDLAGFAAVEGLGGISVAVGERVDAMRRMASPVEVRRLLTKLADGEDAG